ncbi:erythromycin esterase family protein [Calidithermus terrae]|nr:erythromycin esterase family protein [Calidithermus terrae]
MAARSLGRTASRWLRPLWGLLRFLSSLRGSLFLCALALLAGLGLEWANRPVVAQLRAEAHPITGSPAALSPADRAHLRRLVGGARVVGLGEGSHGSKEILEYKASVVRFLVEEMGFSVLGLETADASFINTFIHLDTPMDGAAAAQSFLPTREIAGLLGWMAEHRRRHPRRPLDVFGFDVPSYGLDERARDVRGWLTHLRTRDRLMAESAIGELERRFAGRRAIIWAHNSHVAFPRKRLFPPGLLQGMLGVEATPMGWYLRQRYGSDYFVLATTFHSGTVWAVKATDRTPSIMPLSPALPGTAISAFHQAFGQDFLLDLRAVRPGSPLENWMQRPQLIHEVASVYLPYLPPLRPVVLPDYFDALLFIDKTTAAEAIPTPP